MSYFAALILIIQNTKHTKHTKLDCASKFTLMSISLQQYIL